MRLCTAALPAHLHAGHRALGRCRWRGGQAALTSAQSPSATDGVRACAMLPGCTCGVIKVRARPHDHNYNFTGPVHKPCRAQICLEAAQVRTGSPSIC